MSRLYNSTEATTAALFSDRGVMVHLNGGGWLNDRKIPARSWAQSSRGDDTDQQKRRRQEKKTTDSGHCEGHT